MTDRPRHEKGMPMSAPITPAPQMQHLGAAGARPSPSIGTVSPLRPRDDHWRRPAAAQGSRDGPAAAASRARHPSVARSDSPDEARCPACGGTTVTAGTAVAAVTETVALARSLLEDAAQVSDALMGRRLERVAQLRDELHALGNRLARVQADDVDEPPAVWIGTATAATRAMSPPQLLHELDRSARRLMIWMSVLPPDAWQRPLALAGSKAAAARLVERVLHDATHDLLDLVHAERHPSVGDVERRSTARSRSPR
jgi:hypothetical protein